MRYAMLVGLCGLLALAMVARAEEPANLLKNGDFAQVGKDSFPVNWKFTPAGQEFAVVKEDLPKGAPAAIKITMKKPNENQSSFSQVIKNPPKNTKMVLSGQLKGTAPRMGYLQVKLKAGGKEIRRDKTPWNTTDWESQKLEFSTDDATELSIECRYSQSEKVTDQSVFFADVKLEAAK